MALKTEDLIKKALKVITEKKLIFVEEISPMIGISKHTFYNHKLHEVDSIKEAIEENKINIKTKLRSNWFTSDNPTAQSMLYKLAGTKEERDILSNQKVEVSGSFNIVVNSEE